MDSNVLTRRKAMAGLAWLFACGGGNSNPSKKAVTPMSDVSNGSDGRSSDGSNGRVKIYEQYLSAWSAITDEERAERLRGSLSPSVVFVNPTQTRRGLTEVAAQCAAFQKRTPGGSFVADEMLGFDHHAIVKWHLVDRDGKPGSFDVYGFDYGYDALTFDSNGRIESIVMFVHVKSCILK
jgi:hypothetical protein